MVPPPQIKQLATPTVAGTNAIIDSKEVNKHFDETITTTGTIVSTRLIESNQMTLLNVGANHPNQDFTIVIRKDDRSKFNQPEIDLKGKTVTVTGKVTNYKGLAEIIVTNPKQLIVQ